MVKTATLPYEQKGSENPPASPPDNTSGTNYDSRMVSR